MRAAPPVEYPVARRGLIDGAGGILAGFAVTVPVGWMAWQLYMSRLLSLPFGAAALVAGGVLAALLALALYWRAAGRHEPRRLRWDGARWQLLAEARAAEELPPPEVRIDLGGALLVRLRRARGGATLHVALERSDAPAAWHALRVALANSPKGLAGSSALPGPGVTA